MRTKFHTFVDSTFKADAHVSRPQSHKTTCSKLPGPTATMPHYLFQEHSMQSSQSNEKGSLPEERGYEAHREGRAAVHSWVDVDSEGEGDRHDEDSFSLEGGSTEYPTTGEDNTESEAGPAAAGAVVEMPNHDDIIVGRGKGVNNRAGNMAFRTMIQHNCDRYFELEGKGQRSIYVKELVREFQLTRRFLVPREQGGYEELGQRGAESKVGQSLRYEYKKINAKRRRMNHE